MEMSRRGLLTGLVCLVAAPAIVRAGSLMPVKAVDLEAVEKCWTIHPAEHPNWILKFKYNINSDVWEPINDQAKEWMKHKGPNWKYGNWKWKEWKNPSVVVEQIFRHVKV